MSDSVVAISPGLAGATSAANSKLAPSSPGRIPVLDGIRGIAVLLVMTYHFWVVGIARAADTPGTTPFWEHVYAGVVGMGWIGVDLFFVLSGFLITGILYDARELPHYLRVFYCRRIVRIFPLYYAALTIFFLLGPLVMAHVYHPALAELQSGKTVKLLAWTYLLNWYEGFRGWNAVAHPLQHFWSLSIEEQFYLIWPFMVMKVGRRHLIYVCFAIMGGALTLRAVMYLLHFPFAAYTWTICRADSLAIGAITALAARDPQDWQIFLKWARRLVLPALGAVVVGRILNPRCTVGPGDTPTFFMSTMELTLIAVLFAACTGLAVSTHEDSAVHRLLASPLLRFFGKSSYCLYVCHLPIIVILARAGLNSAHLNAKLHSDFLSFVAVDGTAFTVSIAVAFVSWHLYEKHWLKLKDLRGLRREPMLSAPLAVQ